MRRITTTTTTTTTTTNCIGLTQKTTQDEKHEI